MPSVENSRDVAVLRDLYQGLMSIMGGWHITSPVGDPERPDTLMRQTIPRELYDLSSPIDYSDKRRTISRVLEDLAYVENIVHSARE